MIYTFLFAIFNNGPLFIFLTKKRKEYMYNIIFTHRHYLHPRHHRRHRPTLLPQLHLTIQ
jgi:hypothetical protein